MDSAIIEYRKKGTSRIQKTFTPADTFEEALQRFLKIKGSKLDLEILSIQDYDRVLNKPTGEKITLPPCEFYKFLLPHES